jgi:hypothetical protein
MGSVWEGFIRFESSREHGVFVEKLPKKAVMINTYGLPIRQTGLRADGSWGPDRFRIPEA